MLSFAFGRLFGRAPPAPQAGGPPRAAPFPSAEPPQKPKGETSPSSPWPAGRLALTDQLWGPGFISAGGDIEILRLIRPLGLSSASSIVVVGIGAGGPAAVIVKNTGCWITGLEADPALLAAAARLAKDEQLGRKLAPRLWDPGKPDFTANSANHILALEPLRGPRPEPVIDGLASALRPGGQMVITELAAPSPLPATDGPVRRWAKLEHRDPGNILPPVAVPRMLSRVGLDVRIAEDITDRHLSDAMLGWRVLVRDLRENKPDRMAAAFMVSEAELWLLRRRLMLDGRLRMMRYHAIKKVPLVQA